jgi:hypothetical protein
LKTKYALSCCDYMEQTLNGEIQSHFGQEGIERLLPELEGKITGKIFDYFKSHCNKVQSLDKFFVGQIESFLYWILPLG